MNKSRLLGAVCAFTLVVLTSTAYAVSVSGQGTWESTLEGRDLDGDITTAEAYYDRVLGITWLADANANGTSMSWEDANSWADALDVNGINNWRLPTMAPINGISWNIDDTNNATSDEGWADSAGWVDNTGNPVSEMGHMYYVTLGNLGFCTPDDLNPTAADCGDDLSPGTEQPGWGLTNTGYFSNIQNSRYWSDTEYGTTHAWRFRFDDGDQRRREKIDSLAFAWAVHDGSVGTALAAPIPPAIWLFGSGLLGLVGMARRKKA
jgi:hypothetical protein